MTWPNKIPPHLLRVRDAVLLQRDCAAPEVWGEVRDWLIKHGVEAPNRLPEDVPPEGPCDTAR